jgi:multidrug efflux system outer membrane protein
MKRTVAMMRAGLAASLPLLLAACVVGPDYKRPAIEMPAAFPAAPAAGTQALQADWWTLYGDATLNELVATTLKSNVDLRRAAAQIEQAEAVLSQASAAILPEIDLNGSSNRARSIANTSSGTTPITATTNRLTLSTSFELDFWGKLRRATEAARAQALASRFGRDVTALTLAGTTTQAYITLRSLDSQIAITRETLGAREQSLGVVQSRARGGLASDLDVNQAESARADAALQLSELLRNRALIEHQIGALTGKLDLAIAPGDLISLPLPALPPAGLPASLIERRPDVRQAEQTLIAANEQIGVARAAQLPTFSLAGSFGGQSSDLGNLLNSASRIWSIGPSFSFPVFDAGKYAARTREAEALQKRAVADYQKTIETAFREVADALTNVQQFVAAAADQQSRVDAARNVLRLSQRRYEAGYSAYLEVLDAQRSANVAEQGLVQSRQALLSFTVDLMKALGGGWSPGNPIARVP